ncbi:MATE efflux family protein [Treponema primitia ZAS-2]|uniref:Multidrug export protein MepA n=1 Tax=Treponema primitia (strain ATCC BAA-887 / DSM 12427 / ZAS-2) TaxID=545694 RepID=F5YQY6_TREPZ|nr:MATE family efflux transporter [Treponema primitia]AEF84581.1 MATE efflux family protein [Treponema primitia ZAS-2]
MNKISNPNQNETKLKQMTTTPVEKLVVTLGIPSMAIMMISGLYNMADTYFVSSLGTSAVASVGIVFPLMAIIQAMGFLFGQGSGNYISRELGAQRVERASQMAATGFFSCLIVGALIATTGLILINPLVRALGSTPTILPYAISYMRFILIGAPFMASSLVLNNQLRFQGSSFSGMIGMMTGAILNVLLDPLLIFVCKMGVMGASLATAISQFVSCSVLITMGYVRKGNIPINPRHFSPSIRNYKEILRGGFPSLLRQGMQSAMTIVINHLAGVYGDAAIAAISIVNRIGIIAGSAVMGMGQGFQPVCGFNYGAKRYDRVKKAFWFCVGFATITMSVLAILMAVFAPRIISLFRRDDADVIFMGARYLRFHCIAMPFIGWVALVSMMTQTMGKAREASILSLARQGLFLLPSLLIFPPILGLLGIQISQPISDIASFFFAIPFAVKILRKDLHEVPIQ